jgi:hypothetical protein
MSDTFTATIDPDERVVEEVHCIECGAPISAIPSWYATVRVKFTCDVCRQKSPRLGQSVAAAAAAEPEAARDPALLGEVDGDDDLALEDAEIEDDADVSLDEAEVEE